MERYLRALAKLFMHPFTVTPSLSHEVLQSFIRMRETIFELKFFLFIEFEEEKNLHMDQFRIIDPFQWMHNMT